MTLVSRSEQVSLKFIINHNKILGSFGRVRLAKHKLDGKYYAAKILKKAEIIKLKQVDHIMNETNILFQLSHPFIVNTSSLNMEFTYSYETTD
jgi:protein kinase X